jgi:hypothetical protein
MLVISVLASYLWIADVTFHRIVSVNYKEPCFCSKLFYDLEEFDQSVSANNVYCCFSLSK